MGEGDIDLAAYFARFKALCPGSRCTSRPSQASPASSPIWIPRSGKRGPHMPAASFARFVALAERGKPRSPWEPPAGVDRTKAEQDYQKGELERSLVLLEARSRAERRVASSGPSQMPFALTYPVRMLRCLYGPPLTTTSPLSAFRRTRRSTRRSSRAARPACRRSACRPRKASCCICWRA